MDIRFRTVIMALLFFAVCGALAAQPYDKEFYHLRAQQYLIQGNLSGALEIYNLLIGTDPADVRAFNGRGMVFERRADLNAAMADYEHALELNANYAEAQHNRDALLQKYKNEKPPTVTFADQGTSRNSSVFNKAALPTRAPLDFSEGRSAVTAYAAEPAPAAAAPLAVRPASFPKEKTAASAAQTENWRPVPQQEPVYFSGAPLPVTPGKFRDETGYGVDSQYLGPSQYQQPATASHVDGSLVRITPSKPEYTRQAAAAPAKFPVPAASQPGGTQAGAIQPFGTQAGTMQAGSQFAAREVGTRQPKSGITSPASTMIGTGYEADARPQTPAASAPAYRQTAPAGAVVQTYSGAVRQAAPPAQNQAESQAAARRDSVRLSTMPNGQMLVTQTPVEKGSTPRASDTNAFNSAGLLLFNAGKFEQAIKEFTEAVNTSPEFTIAYNNRGVAYAQIGRFDLAMNDFNQALRINPYYFDAQHNREIARPFASR